jgi:hypothetical protein
MMQRLNPAATGAALRSPFMPAPSRRFYSLRDASLRAMAGVP